jgi:hypothetical protein
VTRTKITPSRRLAVSPVIATLLLIAIAVAAAIIVYAFVTGLIGGLTGGGGSNLITVSGNLLVPSGTTTGYLVINIKNSAANPITNVVATFPSSFTGPSAGDTCFGPVATCTAGSVQFTFGAAANPITAANPLPVGSETSATAAVTQTGAGLLQTGRSYSVSITVTFATGSPQTQLISITAQL